jgi:hypothetical protein
LSEPTDHIIGGWYVELGDGWHEHQSSVRRLCVTVEKSTQVLNQEGILRPQNVQFRNWLEEGPREFRNAGLADIFIEVGRPPQGEWLYRNITEIAQRADHPDAIPEIIVHGTTDVIVSGAVQHHHDACELTVVYDGAAITAMVTTYSTVWLPNDLSGKPQGELLAENAVRLTRTLRRLSEVFGAEVQPMEPSRYAVSTPDGLDNHRDIRGNVVAIAIR